jgi:hypothetical protein
MNTYDALAQTENLVNTVVTIEGFLIVTGRNSYIAQSEANTENSHEAIAIAPTEDLRKLLEPVPILVGGSRLYSGSTKITGVLCKSKVDPFPAALTEISSVVFWRKGNLYHASKKDAINHMEETSHLFNKTADTISITVHDALANREALLNHSVSVSGFLVTTDNAACIVPDKAAFENTSSSIQITNPNVLDRRLSAATYCSAKAPYVYQDYVEIAGTLCEATNKQFPVALTDVTFISLKRKTKDAIFQIEVS